MKLMELYKNKIMGATKGLDRIRFRGTIRWLASERGLGTFMNNAKILLKDFSGWVGGLTAMVRQSCESRADELGIEKRYLRSSGINKEKLVRQIAAEKGITEGCICMLSVVEPCVAPMVKGNKSSKKLELLMAPRKCIFLYHYFDDPLFGFGHVRIQSWVPFNIFICLNGRHWLERQLQKKGIGYIKDGNCFPWIEDIEAAQVLMDKQLRTDWPKLLNRPALQSCPGLSQFLKPLRPEYYWSADETEWATDIMFRSVEALDALYPSLLHHAMLVSDSRSVMRYFGRRNISKSGQIKSRAPKEVMTDFRRFYEGVRVKHWLKHNSDKFGKQEQKRYSSRTTRSIKLLRVHGLVKKVSKENRYMLTVKVQKFACALMSASAVDIKELTKVAA